MTNLHDDLATLEALHAPTVTRADDGRLEPLVTRGWIETEARPKWLSNGLLVRATAAGKDALAYARKGATK